MNKYTKKLIVDRIAAIEKVFLPCIDKDIKFHLIDIDKANKDDLIYPTLLDCLGKTYILKGDLVAEKINLNNELINKK